MLRLALALVLAVAAALPALAERRVALVFGLDAYRALRPLDNAGRDAQTMAETLRALGFAVTVEPDRDLRRMRRALDEFAADHAGADVALVFYAGHGVEIGGDNRLLPVDADPSSLESLLATSLPLDDLRATAVRVAPVVLILVDACREDPFGEKAADAGRGGVRLAPRVRAEVHPGMGRMGRAENTLFAFAAAPGAVALDGRGNSPFTTALARYLGTPGVEIRSALTLVQQEVYDATAGRQLPYVESGLPRLFFAAADGHELPERERLLLAMAGLDDGVRSDVEATAAAQGVPLAPLYGAVIAAGLDRARPEVRRAGLAEAAGSYLKIRDLVRTFAGSDPEVDRLRRAAEDRLAVGALNEALDLARKAQQIDVDALLDIDRVRMERTLSAAASAKLVAGIARTALDYPAVIAAIRDAEALYASVETMDLPWEARHDRNWMLFELGYVQRIVGDSAGAVEAYRAMQRAAETWLEVNPGEPDAQRDVAVALDSLGNEHMSRGELDAAGAAFEKAAVFWRQLVADRPDNPDAQRDLIVNLIMLGDLRLRRHEMDGAHDAYAEALAIADRKRARHPEEASAVRDLLIVQTRLADLLLMADRRAEAEAYYRAAYALARQSAERSGDDASLRDFLINVNKLGDVLLDRHPAEALDYYVEAEAIARTLLGRDPDNAKRHDDMVVALLNLGETLARFGRIKEAVAYLHEAQDMAARLVARDPRVTEWQRSLALSFLHLAEAGEAPRDNLGRAATVLRGLFDAGIGTPREKSLLDLIERAIGDLDRGLWPPRYGPDGMPAHADADPPAKPTPVPKRPRRSR